MSTTTKVLLVDDHTIIRDGLAAVLSNLEGIRVVGSLSSAEEAINSLDVYQPDVIVMDIIMEGMTGLEATRWIKERRAETRIIIMSSEVNKEFVAMGIKSGIDGYLAKDSSKEILIEAIRTVVRGEKYFTQAITSLIFEDFYKNEKSGTNAARKVAKGLTARENEILALVASGKTNQEIADTLFISIKTVETHKSNILDKLGLRNTAELVRYAIKHNIIVLD